MVDLGCGTGTGALDIGAIGIDSSPTMAGAALARGVPAVCGSVEVLPVRRGSLGGVRCDRVLYHLAEPASALAEAARVLRSGGRIVCVHPDHESVVLEVPGAPDHLVALTKWVRLELNYVSGRVPRQVPRLLGEAGFDDVHTEAFTLVVEDPEEPSLALPHWLRSFRRQGRVDVTDHELAAWDAAIESARRDGGYLFTLTYLLTFGTLN